MNDVGRAAVEFEPDYQAAFMGWPERRRRAWTARVVELENFGFHREVAELFAFSQMAKVDP